MAKLNHYVVKNGTIIDVENGKSFVGSIEIMEIRLKGFPIQ